jgi:pyridoxal 5'-phosphate synthase pdxT subunit
MDIVVDRNAFGRQVDSFAVELDVAGVGDGPFAAVFIRAPKLVEAKGQTQVLARLADGTAVAAQEGHWLVTSFHPELTDDTRLHAYFVGLCAKE